jgi:methionine-S-sulfoxide reductase
LDRRALLLAVLAVVAVPTASTLLKDLGVGYSEEEDSYAPLPQPGPGQAVATFAGGCFWCMEAPFDILDGVLATTSGYTGGSLARPSYGDVCTERTGHREAVQVLYDPSRVSYDQLLDAYWRAIDPTQEDGQFVDRGPSYTPAIFAHTPEQKEAAEASRAALEASGVFGGKHIVVPVLPAAPFWAAESYHQDYYSKSGRYPVYRLASGRDAFIASKWGADYITHEQEEAKRTATELQARRAAARAAKAVTP